MHIIVSMDVRDFQTHQSKMFLLTRSNTRKSKKLTGGSVSLAAAMAAWRSPQRDGHCLWTPGISLAQTPARQHMSASTAAARLRSLSVFLVNGWLRLGLGFPGQ